MNARAGALLLMSISLVAAGQERPWTVSQIRADLPRSPEEAVRRFCRLDRDGAQLTPKGREEIAALFVRPGKPPDATEVGVLKDRFDIRPPLRIRDDLAEVRADYTHLGFLNLTSAVFRTEAAYLHLIADFRVTLTNPPTAGAPRIWKIEGEMPPPLLGVTGAIRFLEDLRARTDDARIRRNADRSIAGLKRQ